MSQVILAEDEAQLRRLISSMLADRGVSVTEAADGAEALQRLKDDPSAALPQAKLGGLCLMLQVLADRVRALLARLSGRAG